MSSLWTPDGERPVGRPAAGPSPEGLAGDVGGDEDLGDLDEDELGDLAADDLGDLDEDELEEQVRAELADARRRLAEVPAETVVANHAMGLFELGAIHLSGSPPNLADARLAIDALAALVEGVGDRLGENGSVMRDALAQIRLAYVQVSSSGAPG
jgi:hypothetical protein